MLWLQTKRHAISLVRPSKKIIQNNSFILFNESAKYWNFECVSNQIDERVGATAWWTDRLRFFLYSCFIRIIHAIGEIDGSYFWMEWPSNRRRVQNAQLKSPSDASKVKSHAILPSSIYNICIMYMYIATDIYRSLGLYLCTPSVIRVDLCETDAYLQSVCASGIYSAKDIINENANAKLHNHLCATLELQSTVTIASTL